MFTALAYLVIGGGSVGVVGFVGYNIYKLFSSI